jgi:hypothetical protein
MSSMNVQIVVGLLIVRKNIGNKTLTMQSTVQDYGRLMRTTMTYKVAEWWRNSPCLVSRIRFPAFPCTHSTSGPIPYGETVSLANWDIFWYTRGFPSIDTERAGRHLSKLLTYPMSIAGVLHEYSSLTTRNQRITPEGLRSLVGSRTCLRHSSTLLTAPL